MKHNQTVLIVVDDSEKVGCMGKQLAEALPKGKVVLMNANDFAATDILPADACFIGCDKRTPASFTEFQRVLQGINLAGRPCGLFSTASSEAIDYLRDITASSELKLNPVPLMADGAMKVGDWVSETLARR